MQRIIYRDLHLTIFQSALFQTNSTVVRTDDVVLVVDPAWLPEEVLNIRQYVDSIRGERPVFLIFTHSDYDHILGYKAFRADKVFVTKAFAENPKKAQILAEVEHFDHSFYIKRPYPIEYPRGDFLVFKEGVQYRQGQTKLTFYPTPGHTADSMMIIVWQLGLCIAGDYLSPCEFPLIEDSVAYEQTLEKLPLIHDRNWFTRLVPGHGDPALTIADWLRRRTESLAYIYALRESVASGVGFDEESLWNRYSFPRLQREFHAANLEVIRKEYAEGRWVWDQDLSKDIFERQRRRNEALARKHQVVEEEEPVVRYDRDDGGNEE